MKILFASSELDPFATSGSSGASVLALASELRSLGHDVSVVLPYYRSVREVSGAKAKLAGVRLTIPLRAARYPCDVRESRTSNGVQVFFVERDEFFDRSGLYGFDGRDYQDNAARFVFFSKAVVELARRLDPSPEIIHAVDWQTALVPVFAAESGLAARRVLGIQSLEFQGNFWSYDFSLTNLPGSYFSARGLEYYGSMNLLKGGILYAERVILPGARKVTEAQTPAGGCGLDPVLREHSRKLEGVLPGMDVAAWNPATDKALSKRFKSPDAKAALEKSWIAKAGMQSAPEGSLMVLSTDAMLGDGLKTISVAFDRLAEAGARLAIFGKPSDESTRSINLLVRRHSDAVVWIPEPDESAWRQAIAAATLLLLPAPVEPGVVGLTQAVCYGVVPVALACGGIHEVVPPVDRGGAQGVGFYYYEDSADALVDAVRGAAAVRADRAVWSALQLRAMNMDFSWKSSARQTEALYASLIAKTPARIAA